MENNKNNKKTKVTKIKATKVNKITKPKKVNKITKPKKVTKVKVTKVKANKLNNGTNTVTNTVTNSETNSETNTLINSGTNNKLNTKSLTKSNTKKNNKLNNKTNTESNNILNNKTNTKKKIFRSNKSSGLLRLASPQSNPGDVQLRLPHMVEQNAKINFNKILVNCLKNKDFSKIKNLTNNNILKLEKDYENSFDDIHSFRNSLTKKEINDIDTILYHDENNDGMMSCAIAYHYLKENNKNNIKLIPIKPGKPFPFDKYISNRNVLIVDVELKENILKIIKKLSTSLIVIDDHYETLKDSHIFNGNDKHAACAYTWKFFYPKLDVPKVIQFIDDSDAKLFLKHLPKTYTHLFNHGLGFRYTHNKSPEMMLKKRNGILFDELWLILIETIPNFWITAGFYYDEVTENLKEQIAINARSTNFQGYKVGVLNFNAPSLVKPVCRQIISNFRARGEHIDFVVVWGYEYTNNCYKVQLIDDHYQTKINMREIARKLGNIGKHEKGGGGHPHVGNFYWAKTNNQDIWDLFSKQYL